MADTGNRFRSWLPGLLVATLSLMSVTACSLPPTPPFVSDILVFCDATGDLSIEQISDRAADFKKTKTTPPRQPANRGACWFRYELKANAQSTHSITKSVYLEVNTVTARTLEVYENGRPIARMGTSLAFNERPIPHRAFITPVEIPAKGTTTILFKVTSRSVAELPLRIWRPSDFHQAAQAEYYALGIFVGVLLIMAGYNLSLGLAIRERSYFYYVLYTLSVGLFILSEDGLLMQWLDASEGSQINYFVISVSMLGLSSMLFARSYLETARFSKFLDRLMIGEAIVCAILLLLGLTILPANSVGLIINLNNVLVILLSLWAIGLGVKNRHRPAYIFAIALFVFIVSVVGRTIWLLDIPLASNDLLRHGPKFGVAIELTILSLGLADRYNRLRDEMITARIRHATERERLLGEVHDSIGARLSTALMQLPANSQQSELRRILESALEYARDLSTILRMPTQDSSFEEDVAGYIRTLDGLPGIQIEFTFDPALNTIEGQQRIDLTRIFQEWTSNCVRHGGARQFTIRFHKRKNHIVIGIRSNGLSFAWRGQEDSPGAGSGLRGIVSRSQRLAGRARSFASPDQNGSIFVLQVKDDR